jgi:hypothetical protein
LFVVQIHRPETSLILPESCLSNHQLSPLMITRNSILQPLSLHQQKASLKTRIFKIRFTLARILILASIPANGRGAKVVSQEDLATFPTGRPAIVYVQDFKVEKESSSNDQQALGGGRARGLIDQVKSATGMQSSQVVDLMASSLVSDLNRGGVKAQRLDAGQALPKNGWLVRGVFTEVDEGSRVLRAEVGFGAGSTDLAVLVSVADLRKGKPESFYKLEAEAGSRKLPGAVVTRNPYVAAAKFVMSRRDLPKNIRQTAQTVADQIIRRARAK